MLYVFYKTHFDHLSGTWPEGVTPIVEEILAVKVSTIYAIILTCDFALAHGYRYRR